VVSGGSRREETEMRRDTVRKRRNRFRMTRLGVQGHIGRRGKSIKLWRIKKLMWHLRRVWGYKNGNNFVVPGFYGGDAQVGSKQELYERTGEISA